ncbi:membrane protein insertion efficiency factor YidD [Pasteurellaceae bacterium 15-036681]|nr:membrane protein insertion efficiency factor YidD [Pasteurellaceae bacterium 15-036681]
MASPHSPCPECNATNRNTKVTKPSLLTYPLLALVYFYRYCISPFLAPRCRFYPTCSQYALDALRIHGAFKGSYLAIKRILRCNPLSEGGEDPVPCKCNKGK